jgi:PST family polysaccharide transporter
MTETMSLRRQVAAASKWSTLSAVATNASTPVVFLVLARLLSPEDFGVVAIATLLISFSHILWNAGMSKALIQRAGDTEDAGTVVFWINVILGLGLYLVLFIVADYLAQLFEDPRVAGVIRVQGIQLILMSTCAVHIALLEKDLNFKFLFWVRLMTSLVPGLASIPLALAGAGYWSIVIGTLFGSATQMVLLWYMSCWRPAMRFDTSLARSMFRFGAWATGEGLLGWFYAWGDILVVGIILSAADLGLYRTGSLLVTMVFALVLAPLNPVMFSVLSRFQNDRVRLSGALNRASKAVSIVAISLGAGTFVLQDYIAYVLFDEKWAGIAQVLGWIGLTLGLSWTVGLNAAAYRAIGRPDITVKLNILLVSLYLPVYVTCANFGLQALLYGRFAIAIIGILLHIYIAHMVLGRLARDYLEQIRWAVISGVGAAFTVSILMKSPIGPEPSFFALLGLAFVGLLTFVILILPEWRFIRSTVAYIIR